MSATTEQLQAAKEIRDPSKYIEAVKTAIHAQMRAADVDCVIEDTLYFAHSAIPDFILRWPGESVPARNVFIRSSYANIVAAKEVRDLREGDPVYVALSRTADEVSAARLTREAGKAPYSLLTDADAVATFEPSEDPGEGGDDSSAELGPSTEVEESPLRGMIRSNFLRGARGLIDTERAAVLNSVDTPAGVADLKSVLNESFTEAAVSRMDRVSTFVALALAEDPETAAQEADRLGSGSLSRTEMATLLPWLLRQTSNADEAVTSRLWVTVGNMMGIRDLLDLGRYLKGASVTPLIEANAKRWRLKATYRGMALPERNGQWWVDEARPVLYHQDAEGSGRYALAWDGRRLNGQVAGASPRWSNYDDSLRDFRLASVNLRGVNRSVYISAEQSEDVAQDARDVVEQLSDQFFVTDASVTVAEEEGESLLRIFPDRSLVQADKGASLEQQVHVASSLLAAVTPAEAPADGSEETDEAG